jgi:hypothetical protein
MLAPFHATSTCKGTHWPAAIVRSSARSSRSIGSSLRTIWAGLLEGLIAHRRYEEMMSQGIPPDRALRRALGIFHGVCLQASKREGEHGQV